MSHSNINDIEEDIGLDDEEAELERRLWRVSRSSRKALLMEEYEKDLLNKAGEQELENETFWSQLWWDQVL